MGLPRLAHTLEQSRSVSGLAPYSGKVEALSSIGRDCCPRAPSYCASLATVKRTRADFYCNQWLAS